MSKPITTDPQIDRLAIAAVETARTLIAESAPNLKRYDRANRKRFTRLFKDPKAISVTVSLTDEVMRISSAKDSVRILRNAAKDASIAGFGLLNTFGLKLIALVSRVLPRPVLFAVHTQVKLLSKGIILPAESKQLARQIKKRGKKGIRLNINVLGEAVLGEAEANERFERVVQMMQRSEVDYVSVKLSSVASQIIALDREGTLERVCEKLRLIYRTSISSKTFVNLDMEEFRDLRLTVDAFKLVLSEGEFKDLYAGLVLQAYLPESHEVFAELVEWALQRNTQSGGVIKIRLVKGANLAMEKAEAELHGWVAAPYKSKADVDASYSRLLDTALRPEHAKAVRIGVASHNLFHIAFALEIAKARNVMEQLDLEMLEGMANPEALAIAKRSMRILLYAPVTRGDDFASAVAYLVRRLDENTAIENYLRSSFEIGSDPEIFTEQSKRFLTSATERHQISTQSIRHQSNDFVITDQFENAPNADITNLDFLSKLDKEIGSVLKRSIENIPIVIDGKEIFDRNLIEGNDPGDNGKVWYKYCVAKSTDIDAAIKVANKSFKDWNELGALKRAEVLKKFSKIAYAEQEKTIAIMTRDAGKTVSEADPEVSEAIDFANYYALSAISLDLERESSPVGVVVVVPPWNFPYAIPTGGICAALAAGNSVIFKSAPETVATSWHLVNQLWKAGVPKNVLQFVSTEDNEVGQSLITNDGVSAVILTGGYSTALLFSSWRNELNLLAETSGKNSMVLTACCDIDVAVKDLVQSAFGHAGQKCSAASLAIVDKSIYQNPNFIKQLIDAVRSLKVGAGYSYSTTVGPIIKNAEAGLQRALTQLDEGEQWLLKPEQLDEAGLLWSPGVKTNIKAGSWSHLNEWFGPVLGIMVSPDLQTSVIWHNATDYGLTAGIQSLDAAECEYWIENVEAGNLYVNRGVTGAVVNRQPFGGWKKSSVGATAKAGGANYVATLRNWNQMKHFLPMKEAANKWLKSVGGLAIDHTSLNVEQNLQRYRQYKQGFLIRIESGTSKDELDFLSWLKNDLGVITRLSSDSLIPRLPNLVVESVEEFAQHAKEFDRVRWLSAEIPPVYELMKNGISCDRRPITLRGDIEIVRWFLEQSVSITQHRYGNTNAGPKPSCSALKF
ncbi:RHH-type transcriptional regulator, proline utilization regulon repressor / proline dehydrogenase / delta 1-pyrroline-5-carboxylate dehydrogenase [Candidatus Nanopelagicus hibericus]|uniref:L-glutamate gamma-semialdehyde dehydrogenase n=1 Tax=Candidatus Nanopelagicus hibericus TaxID=1884915 RepID=A0A249K8Y8_9ACTN|nr:bifunctional proline dehydrogenase/L-glutamate gamma-semialdehyde dehydrogenase [Candidatus Nanopelagicus hibericus]ASY13244.1 RHH-type transcriptional regulator, proline utilization regulon repressor / proline dehydrogenase / delta 1-pyrroline-5-carboxylate dehydrogenase [Candidatus Nanopelagicus hibericus]